jgi:predicted transport protein
MALANKLHIKPNFDIALLNAPAGFVLDSAETVVTHTQLLGPHDLILLFVTTSAELQAAIDPILAALKPDGLLWFAYPKISSGVATDLTRDVGWQVLHDQGWRGIAQIKIDETWSAVRFRPKTHDSAESALDTQYAGKKAALRPIYDQLVALCSELGDDVDFQVRKTYVAAARNKQFAVIKPSTQTRVDLALKLPGEPFTERLKDGSRVGSGSLSHVVAVTAVADIDAEVKQWLQRAYDNAN